MNAQEQSTLEITGPLADVVAFKARHLFLSVIGDENSQKIAGRLVFENLAMTPHNVEVRPVYTKTLTLNINLPEHAEISSPHNREETQLTLILEDPPVGLDDGLRGLAVAYPALEFFTTTIEPNGWTSYQRCGKGGVLDEFGMPDYDAWCLEQSYLD